MKRLFGAAVLVAAGLAACTPGGTPSPSSSRLVTPGPTARPADTPPMAPSHSVPPVPTSLPTRAPQTQFPPRPSIEVPPPMNY